MNFLKKCSLAIVLSAVAWPVLSAPETFEIDNTHTYPRFSYRQCPHFEKVLK